MGLYDILPRGSQVKCWDCCLDTKHIGDAVSAFYPEYIVLLTEGGYVRVKDGIITKIVENKHRKAYYPTDFKDVPCLDKWGSVVSCNEELATANILGGNYYLWQLSKE